MQTSRGLGSSSLVVVGLAVVLAQGACMRARDPVNRVQPNYVDKRDFIPHQYAALATEGKTPETLTPQLLAKEPVFYTQTTLIAKPTSTGFTGLTSYGEADKIRWQVTEQSLIARQSFEYIKNAPGGAAGIGQQLQTGDVVAVFKIDSHFDIRHEYNTTTGENLNVIAENTTDRPWYQRQFMHVDWSQNLIEGYNSVFAEQEWEGTLKAEPVPVFVNTPNDPNAPLFVFSGSEEAGTRQLDYFDVVNQAVLHPETVSYSYSDHPGDNTTLSAFPLCYMGEGETACTPAQVTLRVAFRRVDPNRDYEPASLSETLPDSGGYAEPIPHLNMERFGFFDISRVGWDPAKHNTLDTQRLHLAMRHNLWVHHHARVHGADTAIGCNFDRDCAAADPKASTICRIDATAFDATHRGRCAPLALAHLDGDRACSSDDDCRQYSDQGGVSRTARCDADTHTCGESFVRCGDDATCASQVSPLSTCDRAIGYTRADNRGLCLMPFGWRQVRPIPYHESVNYPEAMEPVTRTVVAQWNKAFTDAVVAARRHECELTKSVDPATTEPADNPCNQPSITGLDPAFGADAQFIFVGCHSPVWGTAEGPGQHTPQEVDAIHAAGWDLASCGPQGTIARLGDLRYSMIGAITDQDSQGYWGLANLAADPETGEMIAGRGAVWQTITDYYAHTLIEYVQLLNGDLDPQSVANGADLVQAMKQLGAGQMPSKALLDKPVIERGLANASQGALAGIERMKLPGAGWHQPGGLPMRGKGPGGKGGAMDKGMQRLLDGRLLGDGTDRGNTRLASLRGTALEQRLMNLDQARLAPTASFDPTGMQPATLEAASPLRRQSAAVRHLIARAKARVAAYQCGKEAAFNDDLLLGLALRLAQGDPISKDDPEDAAVAFGRDWNFKNSDGSVDYGLMHQWASQFIHHGVLAHELGHSVGQRHNFTASADAINYHDNYWVHRLQGHPKGLRPRYEYLADPADGKYYSDEEISGRVDEWSYSSVMDYKGLNEDAHGLGRYDRAFIKNGYVNLVEAFRRVADVDRALSYSFNTAGNGISTPLDLVAWANGGAVHGLHYTQIPAIFGTRDDGTPDIADDNRFDVFLNETTFADVGGWGWPSFTNATTDGHVLVPYRFDTDDRAGLVWQDQRYDAGPDQYESLHYVASHLVDYYFVNSFARLRTGFSTGHYVERQWGRYLEQLRQTTQLLAFDLISWQDYFASTKGWKEFLTDPNEFGGYTNQIAMNLSVDAMVGILTIPEIGGHISTTAFDGSRLLTVDYEGVQNLAIDVPLNDGRAFESDWRSDVGFWWYDMLDRAGSYYDKVMMLQALTDPQLLLLQRDTPGDIRLFQLSFYTMYPDQMVRLFGALLAEDFNDYAPIVALADETIQRPHVATLNAAPADRGRTLDSSHVAIDPQTHFTIQLWAAVQTIAQFPATYDQRYMELARLWIDGSDEAITVENPDVNTVSFVDPFSHQTYRALHFDCATGPQAGVGCSSAVHPGGGGNEAGVAARMILHLQDLDAVRLQKLGAGDAAGAAAVEQQEHKYLDLINVMRDLTQAFGQGTSQLP